MDAHLRQKKQPELKELDSLGAWVAVNMNQGRETEVGLERRTDPGVSGVSAQCRGKLLSLGLRY